MLINKIKRTPEQYIKWVGGPIAALANFTTLNSQCDVNFEMPLWWLQVKNICEKKLGSNKTGLKELRSQRMLSKKLVAAQKDLQENEFVIEQVIL